MEQKLNVGDVFSYDGKTWEVKSVNGFTLTAKNTIPNDPHEKIQLIGKLENYKYRIIKRGS